MGLPTPPPARNAPHDLPLPGPAPKATPGKTPLPSRSVTGSKPKAAPKRVSLTPLQEANLQVKRALQPQYHQADVEAQRQNQAIQSFTTSIMQQLAGAAPQIGQEYNSAINAQSGMVNAAADSLRAVNPTGDVQKLLDAVGAPQAQGQQIAGNLNNVFNGGAAVGQYVNGVSPLGALRSQGLAAESLAHLQPGFSALAGRQALQSALAQQADARAKISEQQPGLVQNWLNSFTSNKYKAQQIALETQYKDAQLGLSQQRANQGQARLGLDAQRLTVQQRQFNAKQNASVAKWNAQQATAESKIDASVSKGIRDGFAHNSQGAKIIGANGKPIPYKVVTDAKKSVSTSNFPNLTKTQVQHLRQGVAAAFYGITLKDKATGKDKHYPPIGYQEAITHSVQSGYSRAAATRMANRFYMPGQRGRPQTKKQRSKNPLGSKVG